MPTAEALKPFLAEHDSLRERLLEWTAALQQASAGSYVQSQRGVTVLRGLCDFLEHEVGHHFREEELALYVAARHRLPHLADLIYILQDEHDVIRQGLEEFRHELARFNTSGELGRLPVLGQELIARLRKHMEREERQLHAVIVREFAEQDWKELRRLFVDSQVA